MIVLRFSVFVNAILPDEIQYLAWAPTGNALVCIIIELHSVAQIAKVNAP